MGGVYYIHNLIRCLSELPSNERKALHITLEYGRGAEPHVTPVASLVERTHARGRLSHYLRGAGRLLLGYAGDGLARRLRAPYDFVYPTPTLGRSLSPGAGWIPDFQHRHLPELFSEAEVHAREKLNLNLAINLRRVVVSSRMAAEDFCEFYPFSANKVRILRFASAMEDSWLRREPLETVHQRGLPERFFLVSNQFWVHKNHALVIEAVGACHKQGVPVHVVFTGSFRDFRSDGYVAGLRQRISELGLDAHMHLLGQIPREDQVQLFRASLAVVQPSKFEGWSTVVEDARVLGKRIFVSDFPVHLEQLPNHREVFGQDDAQALARLLSARSLDPAPGFDADEERRALAEGRERRVRVAREFLAIAEETSSHG
jgi:glycosyltransferase involved in cell wall biosynthesis